MRQLTLPAACVAPLAIQRQPPGQSDDPRPVPGRVAQRGKSSVRSYERVLRDVLGILPIAHHAVRNSERQTRQFGESLIKLPFEAVRHREQVWYLSSPFMHAHTTRRRTPRVRFIVSPEGTLTPTSAAAILQAPVALAARSLQHAVMLLNRTGTP